MIKQELSRYYRGRLILFINGDYYAQYGLDNLPDAYKRIKKVWKRTRKLTRYKITLANGSTYDEGIIT